MNRILLGKLSGGVIQLESPVDPSIEAPVVISLIEPVGGDAENRSQLQFGAFRELLGEVVEQTDFKTLRNELSGQWERKWDRREAGH